MTKKEYILAVIDALPEWEMWRWIKAMVQNDQLEEDTINKLVIIFKKAMDKLTAIIRENKMVETIHAVDSFDKKEQNLAQQDAESLAHLDSILDDL